MQKRIFLILLSSISLGFSQSNKTTVSGSAPILGTNTMGARQQALNTAFRAAVESGVGTFVKSSTVVENFQLISDKIYSKSEGYVKNFDIIKEGAERGSYSVKISAEVSLTDIGSDLRALGILKDIMGNPKIMSMIEEVVYNPSAGAVLQEEPSASIAVEEKFNAHNFELVDREQVNKIRKQELERMGDLYMDKLIEDPEAISRIAQKALEYGAQYLLMGTSRIEEIKKSGGVYQSNAAFKCKVVDAATAEKIALTQKSESGKGNSRSSANMFAGQRAGEAAADAIMPQIIQNWSKRANSGVAYIVKIYGITSYGTQGRKLLPALKSIPGIRSCNKRLWDASMGRIEFDINFKGGGEDELIDGIFTAVEKIPGFDNFDLEEQTGNNLNFKLK